MEHRGNAAHGPRSGNRDAHHGRGAGTGFAILVHDFSYIDRRETRAQTFLLVLAGILAIMVLGILLLVARRARADWAVELQGLLRKGGKQSRKFQPLLSDVRELIERMASQREADPGLWTAERLKQTLNRDLQGEKIIILANREPYIHNRNDDGSIEVQHPASGLVTALEPIMRACSGVWVAHGSGTADRDTVDRNDHVRVPPHEESYHIRRVWLSEEELQGYYYGVANEGLWPLCHVAHARPIFRAEEWQQYRAVKPEIRRRGVRRRGLEGSDHIWFRIITFRFLAPAIIRKTIPAATQWSFLAHSLAPTQNKWASVPGTMSCWSKSTRKQHSSVSHTQLH